MNRKFEDIIEMLDYDELMKFRKELGAGATKIRHIVNEKIRKKLREHEKICATCSNDLNLYGTSNYTLIFGPDDFKKKASFCGIDCLEYFITKLKYMKQRKSN